MDSRKFVMLGLNVLKLILKELKVFARATGFSIPTCYEVRSFVCKDLSPYSLRVVFQFCQWHMGNFLVNEEHHAPLMKVPVFPICMDRNRGTILKLKLRRQCQSHDNQEKSTSSFLPLMQ